MAAPHKKGLDYFPHDCNHNHKIRVVEAKHGLIGYGVYFKLLETIYANGDHILIDDDFLLVFITRECMLDYHKGIEIFNYLLDKGLFDRAEFEQSNRLTSDGIKARYIEATKRRKKDLSGHSLPQELINDDINEDNVNINPINVHINRQSKVKESKEESKVKESKVNEINNISENKFSQRARKNQHSGSGQEEKEKKVAPKKEKEESEFNAVKKTFLEFYEAHKEIPYYFKAKDAGAITSILNQLKFQFEKNRGNPSPTTEDLQKSFKWVLENGATKDTWIYENMNLSIISSKLNEIISLAKNGRNHNQNKHERINAIGKIIHQQFAGEPDSDF